MSNLNFDAPDGLPSPIFRALLAPFSNADVECVRLIPNGRSNANYRVDLSGGHESLVVRLYVRDPVQAEKEQSIVRELKELGLPVPKLIYSSATNLITGQPYAVYELLKGCSLEALAPELQRHELLKVGRIVGEALAATHRAKTYRDCGFLDGRGIVSERADVDGAGLITHLQRCLLLRRGGERLGPELTRAVFDLAFMEGELLDLWDTNPCLVHGDFSAANILVEEAAGHWRVSGMVDWEFAFSGKPYFDVGQFLRTWPGERGDIEAGFEHGYNSGRARLPRHWKRTSRIADLFAWAEYIARPDCPWPVIAAARLAIADIIDNRER